MKSPLVYLTAVKLKNQVKSILKTPSKLIYGIFLIAMFALMAVSSALTEEELPAASRSLSELAAIVTVFYTVMFLLVFVNGSSGSTAMFTLSDVTMLFPSPLSPKKILFYGLLRQMGLSLLLGFFLLFQYSWLHSLYGITYGSLLLIVVGYGLVLFLAQLCAMAVYVRASGRENAGRAVKYGSYGAAFLYVALTAFACRGEISAVLSGGSYEGLLSAASTFLSTLPGVLFPISGWAAGIVGGALTGHAGTLAVCAVLTVVAAAALVLSILKADTSYYEDAIESAETAQSAITAQKEGRFQEVAPKRVKVGKTGIRKGWGASALYHKHKVENRRSGVFFLSNMSLLFAAIIIAFAFFMRATIDDGEGGLLIGVFFMGTYLQMFSATLGRFNRELLKPYLYLIPEPPLKKLLYALKENLISDCFEAVLVFLTVGLILKASPLDVLLCIAARITFALLFTAGNVLVERVFGTVSSKALILMFYFLALLLMAAPGIAAGIVLMVFTEDLLGMAGLFAGMAVMNAAISVLVLFLCRNMLQYAELNNR